MSRSPAGGSLGIIAGTGFTDLGSMAESTTGDFTTGDFITGNVDTAYGPVHLTRRSWHGRDTCFIARHGPGHRLPPHRVNYRANLQALADAGVTQILAVNVVGGIGLAAGEIVVVDDFIDFTRSRELTYFDGTTPEGVVHVDMTEPYDPGLRRVLLQAAAACDCPVVDGGVYGAFEGPRFETKAEIRMAGAMGVTVVGMTGVPEVVLAAELGIAFACLCLVANPAAGLGTAPITMAQVTQVVATGAGTVLRILDAAAGILADRTMDQGSQEH